MLNKIIIVKKPDKKKFNRSRLGKNREFDIRNSGV